MTSYQFIGAYATFYPAVQDAEGKSLMAEPGLVLEFPGPPPSDGKWIPAEDAPPVSPVAPPAVPEPVQVAPEPEPAPVLTPPAPEPIPAPAEAPVAPLVPEPQPVATQPVPEPPAPVPWSFPGFNTAPPRA